MCAIKFVYIYSFIFIYTCIYTYIYMYIYTYVYAHTHINISTNVYVYTYISAMYISAMYMHESNRQPKCHVYARRQQATEVPPDVAVKYLGAHDGRWNFSTVTVYRVNSLKNTLLRNFGCIHMQVLLLGIWQRINVKSDSLLHHTYYVQTFYFFLGKISMHYIKWPLRQTLIKILKSFDLPRKEFKSWRVRNLIHRRAARYATAHGCHGAWVFGRYLSARKQHGTCDAQCQWGMYVYIYIYVWKYIYLYIRTYKYMSTDAIYLRQGNMELAMRSVNEVCTNIYMFICMQIYICIYQYSQIYEHGRYLSAPRQHGTCDAECQWGMYICIDIYVWKCICICIYIRINIWARALSIWAKATWNLRCVVSMRYVRIYMYIYVCIYTYIYIYIHVYKYVWVYMYIHTNIWT